VSARFYTAWAEHYDAVFPPGPKPGFVATRFAPGARLLDLGCASGGMAFALAERGFAVHGVDLDPALVARAEARLRVQPSPGVSFAVGDMLALPPSLQPFDGALCLGNTLVHLLDRRDRLAALGAVADRVVEGGALLVQIVNYDRVLALGLDRLPTIEREGLRFERRYHDLTPVSLRFEARLELPGGGPPLTVEQPLVPLTRAALDGELRAAGWAPQAWFGGYGAEPWAPDSFGCICLAVRRA
jgi:glycine/sarcosine N-methyltransferase